MKCNFLKPLQNKKAQVIVEYVLLILVAAAMALVLLKFVSVTDQSGIFFIYLKHLVTAIGQNIST